MSIFRTQVQVYHFVPGYTILWVAGHIDLVLVPNSNIPVEIKKYMKRESIHHAKFDSSNLTFTDWEEA